MMNMMNTTVYMAKVIAAAADRGYKVPYEPTLSLEEIFNKIYRMMVDNEIEYHYRYIVDPFDQATESLFVRFPSGWSYEERSEFYTDEDLETARRTNDHINLHRTIIDVNGDVYNLYMENLEAYTGLSL